MHTVGPRQTDPLQKRMKMYAEFTTPVLVVLLHVALGGAAAGADDSCWGEDFSWELCCDPSRWGLVGNPACWNQEFTHLRCCGLSAFPWRHAESTEWDAIVQEAGEPEIAGEYDFVVVGAGSAGSVAASRLAAAPGPAGRGWRVLLLEEGHGSRKKEESPDPDKQPEGATWRDPLKAQWGARGAGTRTWVYQTGKGLGGTAAVNSMIYTRGCASEYRDIGWEDETVLAAFRSLEAGMETPGFEFDPSFHRGRSDSSNSEADGVHLTLVSGTREELPPVFQALVKGFERADIPFRVDPHGSSSMHGVGGIWRSMGCGHPRCQPTRVGRLNFALGRPRASPYKVLVEPLARLATGNVSSGLKGDPGITVMPGALVERVVLDSSKKVVGVEVLHSTRSSQQPPQRSFIRVAKEVVLSAGVFGSPKILMLSGIGEPEELTELGLPTAIPSPEVGRNLLEHVGCSVVATTSVPCPDDFHQTTPGSYQSLGTTRDFMAQLYAFFNVSSNQVGAAGPLDSEIMLLEGCMDGFLSLTFTIIMLQSETTGRIVVQSRHAGKSPHLDYHPLNHPGDLEALANAVRLLYTKVFTAPELQEFEFAVNPHFPIVADFDRLAKWIRANLYYYSHPVGTCRIETDDGAGVVSKRLEVLGAKGIRVADASVFPRSPSGHSDAPSRLAGEMVARFLLQDHAPHESHRSGDGGNIATKALYGFPGVRLPLCGFGTNGVTGTQARTAVKNYLETGGRFIDTALLYNNHADIVAALADTGLMREDVFIVSKLPPSNMDNSNATATIVQMAAELGGYVDLLLLHWPANFSAEVALPLCAQPPHGSWKACRIEAWLAMEAACRGGQVRAIGVSNFGVKHLQQLIHEPDRSMPIAANEVELHPWWPQRALQRYCSEHHIALIAYGSMGSSLIGGAMRQAPNVVRVAKAAGRSAAQVLLRWAVQQGVAVIPHSSSRRHIEENLDVFSWQLTAEQIALLNAIAASDLARTYMPDPEDAP